MVRLVLAIVSDCHIYRRLRDALQPEGIEVKLAMTERSARQAIAEFKPELIVLGHALTDGSGLEFCIRLKSEPEIQNIPTLWVSDGTSVYEYDIAIPLSLGVLDCINLPCSDIEIRSLVRLVTQKRLYMKLTSSVRSADRLTGLWSSGFFRQQLYQQHRYFQRYCRPYAVVLADIDGLRHINLRHGEAEGDRVLRQVGRVLRSHSRDCEPPCRISADAFGIVLKASETAAALRVARRLQKAIESNNGSVQPRLTASFGVAAVDSGRRLSPSATDVYDSALEALRHAKGAGYNLVLASEQTLGRSGADLH